MGTELVTEETTPVIIRALYPCAVALPDGTDVPLAKMIVTRVCVYVFAPGSPRPERVYVAPYTASTLPPTFAPRSDLYRLTTEDGELVARRLAGCGCHARALKGYQPFTPERIGS